MLIRKGGVVGLGDGRRYSDPQLLLIQGEHREVVRLRHDHEQISVLPSAKGEEVIIAKRRTRVSCSDADELARQMQLQQRVRRIVGETVRPLEYDPNYQYQEESPKAVQVIHPSEFISAQEAPPPTPEREISGAEFLMERDRLQNRVKVLDFPDLDLG